MATIVSYSGEDLHNISVAMETAETDISTVYGEVDASFASTGLAGTAGTDIQARLDEAMGKLDTLKGDINKITTSLEADIKEDNRVNTLVNEIYSRPMQ
jgi:hypothetical protein